MRRPSNVRLGLAPLWSSRTTASLGLRSITPLVCCRSDLRPRLAGARSSGLPVGLQLFCGMCGCPRDADSLSVWVSSGFDHFPGSRLSNFRPPEAGARSSGLPVGFQRVCRWRGCPRDAFPLWVSTRCSTRCSLHAMLCSRGRPAGPPRIGVQRTPFIGTRHCRKSPCPERKLCQRRPRRSDVVCFLSLSLRGRPAERISYPVTRPGRTPPA